VEKAAASSGLKIIESAHFNACEDCGHLIKAIQDEGNSAGYYILGNSIRGRHHSPEFDLDENSLRADLNFLTALVHAIADRPQN
jgi:metal-dependent amidase/aminoacylase/carboxypeptidase family protein